MQYQALQNDPYIQELLKLESDIPDRLEFHTRVKPLLAKMAQDKDFLKRAVRRNFDDPGYLNQEWTMYNIPYFHVHETDDFVLKIHLFPRDENYVPGHAAHAIHHHNNYLLTTYAFFGSGYETFLFDKHVPKDANGHFDLKVTKHFHQKDHNPSMVDAWEPHVVFSPESLSATLLIWTPEKKRTTDALRNMGLLKAIKTPLRKVIQMLGMEKQFGIAEAVTLQYYPVPSGKGFVGVREEEYFAPSKAEKGDHVNEYCMRMIFSFLQKADLVESDYLQSLISKKTLPAHFKHWMGKVVAGETIEEVFHRKEINIPQKNYDINDILRASGQEMSQIPEPHH